MVDIYVVYWPETGRLAFLKNSGYALYWTDEKEAEKYAEKCNDAMSFISKLFAKGFKWRVKTLKPAKVNN